ncbi:MAG: hypothetical protein ACKVKF_24745 [Rhodobacterales bacterium]
MADTIQLDIPKNAAVRVLCQDLFKMAEGFRALGLQPHLIDQAIKKLKDQSAEIDCIRSDRAFVIGYNEGWDAAMATGLTREVDDPEGQR